MSNKRYLFVYFSVVVSLAGCSGSDAPPEECQAGQVVTGFKNGKPVCSVAPVIGACSTGQVMTGTNADGTPICAEQKLTCPTDYSLASKDGTPVVCYKATEGAVTTARSVQGGTDKTWMDANDECLKSGAHLCFASEFQSVCETIGQANIILGMWLGDSVGDDFYLFTNWQDCSNFDGAGCKYGYLTGPDWSCYNKTEVLPDCIGIDISGPCYLVGGYCCIDPQPKIQ